MNDKVSCWKHPIYIPIITLGDAVGYYYGSLLQRTFIKLFDIVKYYD